MSLPRRKVYARDKAPAPMAHLRRGRLLPLTPFDAEEMSSYAEGTMFDLVERRRRSNPQLRLYWQVLRRVCQSTDKWPRKENLHRDLKLTLGYCATAYDLQTGEVLRVPDSVSFEEMSQSDFNAYFERAMTLIAGEIGVDPLDLVGGPRR